MAVKAGTAYVDIEGDFSALNRQVASHFRSMTKDANKAGKKVGRTIGIGMAAGIGATVVAGKQLFDFGKDAVDVASDVNESLSKNQVLFGKYAKGIEGFSNRSANAFGISKQAALEYTGTFGNLFNALGVNNRESAKYSKNLLKLAADMASFNNSTPEEALEAIRSGLVGETEPLRRFGVNMNDATLKAQALKMGLIKNTKEALNPQVKALAANALITKQTAAAHGDFHKTSDQLANSQRRLQARWTDVKNTLGTALLPAVKNVTRSLLNIADDVQPKVERAVKSIGRIFGRKDLSVGDKIQRSWDAVKLQFGPMANDLKQGIDDANLDQKFKEVIEDAAPVIATSVKTVGLKSAEYWWAGFKEAPLWAKVASGGWLATKLGLTGPALKGLMSLLGGGGRGGLLSKATPMPVYVVNMGGLPGVPGKGPGGAPIPVPGGKPIPGGGPKGIGKIVSAGKGALKFGGKIAWPLAALDLGVNLIDAKGDPIKAVVNTASDLTFGIVPRMKTEGQLTDEAGKKFVAKVPVDFAITPDTQARIGELQRDIEKRNADIRTRAPDVIRAGRGAIPQSKEQIAKDVAATEEDKAKIAASGKELGTLWATNYVAGVSERHTYLSADQLTKGFTDKLAKLPKEARQTAYDTMVDFSREMERQGRLPKGATGTLIENIKGRLNLLPTGIKDVGKRGMDSLAAQLKRRDVLTAAERTMADLKDRWADFPKLAKFTGNNAAKNFATEIAFLKDKVKNSTGQMRKDAQADLKAIQDDAKKYGKGANTGLDAQLRDMGIKGSKRARNLRRDIKEAFRQMAEGVGTHSGNASQALYDALENMTGNANAILKSLGLKPPPFKLRRPALAPGPGGELRPTQRGAYMDGGKPSGDSILVMAERGEYMLNREAVKKVGKPWLDRLNYGIAPRFQTGGMVRVPGDPSGTGDRDRVSAAVRDLAAYLVRRFKLDIGYGYDPGGGHVSPGHNVTGTAVDVYPGPGGSWELVGDAVAWGVQKGMKVLYDGSRGSIAWPNHGPGNHAHFELQANLGNFGALDKVLLPGISGPAGTLLSVAQGQTRKVRRALNQYINRQFMGGGSEGSESVIGTGFFTKDQLKALWVRAGGDPNVANIMAAVAMAESGGDPKIQGPVVPATGQRAGGLWQIHPPEEGWQDPLSNARMAVRKYNASGFSPWEAYTNGNYIQFLLEGGGVSKKQAQRIKRLIQKGPVIPKGGVIKKVVNAIDKASKKGRLSKRGQSIRNALINHIKDIMPATAAKLKRYTTDVSRFDEYQAAAGRLTNSSLISDALTAAQDAKGSALTDAEQFAIIRNHPAFGKVQGQNQEYWLKAQLAAQGSLRNTLIDAHFQLPKEITSLDNRITTARKQLTKKIEDAKDERERKEKRLKKAKTKAERRRLTNEIAAIDKDIAMWKTERDGSTGIVGQLKKRRTEFGAARTSAGENLQELQGYVAGSDKYTRLENIGTLPLGRLLGEIFQTHDSLNSLLSDMKIPASDTSGAEDREKEIAELKLQIAQDELLRTRTELAQQGVFRNLPFNFPPYGGSFADGGPVPGPIGAPRLITAHGGEVVVPNDGSFTPNVYVSFANGMQWLERFVDIRVDNQTRAQGRRSERQLPGRPGVLR